MKILFIQLPLIDHSYTYLNGNIEYAPAVIAGYIKTRFNHVNCEMLPHIISNYCSDEIIINYIEKIKPDVLSFTAYLWNIERILYLAEKIKNNNRYIKIIIGGPEINHGSILFQKESNIDYYVNGEGEWFFDKILNSHDLSNYTIEISGKKLIHQPQDELIPGENIFDPIAGNMLNVQLDGTIYLELTRGCPYRCTYCYYSKNCLTVRELSFERLTKAIKSPLNYKEIYILSPTLNRSKSFIKNISQLKSLKHKINLHSEMRTDNIDYQLALDLYEAGFRSMEIGLQTLNDKALKEIRRNSNIDKELEGMNNLKRANIDLKIGLIPGLPGDNPESFISTIDKLIEYGFGEDLEIYPLMLLPGTDIYHRAIKEKVEFLDSPPYYLLKGWNFTRDDIKSIINYYEKATGYSHEIHNLPDFTFNETGEYYKAVQFKANNLDHWNNSNYINFIESNVFNFHIKIENSKMVKKGLPVLLEGLPVNVLYNIIIYHNKILEENNLNLSQYEFDSIYTRSGYYTNNSFIFKYYHVINLIETYLKAKDEYSNFVPIYHVNNSNVNDYIEYADHIDYILVEKNVYGKIKNLLVSIYSDIPEYIAFEKEENQYDFYQSINFEFIIMPYSFKTLII